MLNSETRSSERHILRFSVAVLAVFAAFLVRRILILQLGIERPYFFIFYPTVMLIALLGGLWPGLLSTALAALLADVWIIPPVGQFRIARHSDAMALAVFVGFGVCMSLAAEYHRRNQRRVADLERRQLLSESENRFGALLSATSDVVYRVSQDWGEMLQLTGRGFIADLNAPNDEWFQQYIPSEDQLLVQSAIGVAVRTKDKFELEHRVLRADGSSGWVHSRAFPLLDAKGRITEWIGIASDITEKRASEEHLRLAASVFSSALEGIMITSPDGAVVDVNDAFTHVTGYTRDEALGRNPRFLSSGRQDRAFYENMWNSLIKEGNWSGEFWNRRKNGELYSVMQTISSVFDGNGKVQHYVSLFHDITLFKQHESQLEKIAYYDALTGLPNRVMFADRLRQAMAQSRRHKQQLAVALLDLDGFKAVNDKLGHSAGDQLLTALARRMKRALREGDTLARLGGDEFVVVLPDVKDADRCIPLLSRLLKAAGEAMQVCESSVWLSASIGVTLYPTVTNDDADADQLVRQADQAMYQAKQSGRNRFQFFDFMPDHSTDLRLESQNRLRQALDTGEFELYYQPKVKMRTGDVVGAEAFIRWHHPERGLLSPAEFMPVVEDYPLAVEIGDWVIRKALEQMDFWRTTGFLLPVSVNVAAVQLLQDNFVDCLREQLTAHPGIEPSSFELEVLKESALQDVFDISQKLEACRKIGVSIALDDFGSGYSSLACLKHLPINTLKLNQQLVHDNANETESQVMLEAALGMAKVLHHQAIAEGVETVEEGMMLIQIGCELAQGYAIAYPMPGFDLPRWSASWHPDPRWANMPSTKKTAGGWTGAQA